MPIGKNSITKRVATPATSAPAKEENIAPELVATVAAPKAPSKKPATTAAKKTSSAAKKPAAKSSATKKPAATKKETLTPPTDAKKVDTAVIANIAPETVAAVIGHKENTAFEKVQIGDEMPVYLL